MFAAWKFWAHGDAHYDRGLSLTRMLADVEQEEATMAQWQSHKDRLVAAVKKVELSMVMQRQKLNRANANISLGALPPYNTRSRPTTRVVMRCRCLAKPYRRLTLS